MGTRSLTVVRESEESIDIIVLYRQFDGYPSGHGAELKEFLAPFAIVNGLNDSQKGKIANGMGCLAAQLVCNFKNEPGGFYLHPSGERECGEEWIYTVYKHGAQLCLKVVDVYAEGKPPLFNGPIANFDPEAEAS